MPELPDLEYIVKNLSSLLPGKTIEEVEVKEPIVLRMLIPGNFGENLPGQTFYEVTRRGPFVNFRMTNLHMIVHPMLDGRFHLFGDSRKKTRNQCFAFYFEDGSSLRYSDGKKMGKVYVTKEDGYQQIPGYLSQGVEILSPDFTVTLFRHLIQKKRCQVRVFLMDQSLISAIGNAYADEILFEAGIHPKTFCYQLDSTDVDRLFDAVSAVMAWGIREVEEADQPIDVKVRDHMRIRGRKGESCQRCGSTIRREQVLGYDTFFCPRCQSSLKTKGIPWV